MNEQKQAVLEPQIVDLGDAKEVTLGIPDAEFLEESQVIPRRNTV